MPGLAPPNTPLSKSQSSSNELSGSVENTTGGRTLSANLKKSSSNSLKDTKQGSMLYCNLLPEPNTLHTDKEVKDIHSVSEKLSHIEFKDAYPINNLTFEGADVLRVEDAKSSEEESGSSDEDEEDSDARLKLYLNGRGGIASVPQNTNIESDDGEDSDDEADDQDSTEKTKSNVRIAMKPTGHAARLSALAGFAEPKKRRASIAVWADSRLNEISQQKTADMKWEAGKNASARMVEVTAEEEDGLEEGCPEPQSASDHPLSNPKIIAKILHFLPVTQWLRWQTVSTIWCKAITTSPTLLRRIDLTPVHKAVDDSVLIKFLNTISAVHIEILVLKNCWRVTNKSAKEISLRASNLTVLDLSGCWEINDEGLTAIAFGCQLLRGIDLSNCRKITDDGIYTLTMQCASLRDILLSYCKALSDASITHFANYSPNIRRINLQRCIGITDQGYRLFNTL